MAVAVFSVKLRLDKNLLAPCGTSMRQALCGFLAAVFVMIAPTAEAGDKDETFELHHLIFGADRIDILRADGTLTIRRNGKLMRSWRNADRTEYTVTSRLRMRRGSPFESPDTLIVRKSYNSIHCCDYALVFRLAPKFQFLGELAAFWSEDRDLRPPPQADLLVLDPGPFPTDYMDGGIYCEVNLKLRGAALHVDAALQRKPPYSRRLLRFLADQLRHEHFWGDPASGLTDQDNPSLIQFMMSLIYTGNAGQARELMEMAWPVDLPGKKEWAADFWKERKKSPWWREIAALSAGASAGGMERDEDIWPICYSPAP